MALDGNLDAMRLVLEAACGSPHDATLECLALELNLREMNTAHACAVALDRLGEAICAGTCDCDAADIMIKAIHARVACIAANLEPRIAELEKAAAAIDLPRRTHR